MRLKDRAKRPGVGITMALFLGTLCTSALAQGGTAQPAKWKHLWAGYVWVPGMDGTLGIRDTRVDVDTSVSDTLESLKDLDGSFSGHYEGNKGSWTLIFDLMFFRLETDTTTALGRFESEPEQWLAEVAGAFTIYQKALPQEGLSESVQALGGVRYSRLELKVDHSPTGAQLDLDSDWFDPFLGVRYHRDLSKRWEVGTRFDIGGFGVGSDFTWNLIASAAYRFNPKRSLILGWRILDQDFEEDNFKWDIQMSGPFLAWQNRF
jgi:hypothetical protein